MRHGIDLKTHSQCQMLRQPKVAYSPHQSNDRLRDLFLFILEYVLSGGAYRDRTDDPLLAKQVLSQLS